MQHIKDKSGMIENISEQWDFRTSNENGSLMLSPKRAAAFEAFINQGFPGAKNEAYKYTSITKALEKTFSDELVKENDAADASISNHLINTLEGNVLVFINGNYSEEKSSIVSPTDQLIIHDFNSIYADELDSERRDPYDLLNTAFASTGIAIEIPRGKILDKPVIIYNITD